MMGEKPEQRFARRMRGILAEKGWLVLNCTNRSLFDCVILKYELGYPIEFKAKGTPYEEEQRKRQSKVCHCTHNNVIVIRQSQKRGKISIKSFPTELDNTTILDLEEYLE